jgi:galactose mutarotase-like enzyme
MIGRRSADGFEGLTLTSAHGDLEATFVPCAGMIGCSLRDHGAEMLGQRHGLGTYAEEGSTMGIPLLYPWANRLSRDRFSLAGREIDLGSRGLRLKRDANGMAMHGLLTAAAGWRVEEHRATGPGAVLVAEFDFGAEASLAAAFPFPHRLRYEVAISARTLTIALTVVPTGEVAVPIAFGFHPYLRLPGIERSRWRLDAPVERRLRLDARQLPTGEREGAGLEPGPLGERTFDDAFEAPRGGAPFALAGGGRRVEVAFLEGYPYAQVYAPADDALIAIEPMTAPTDALVTGDELPFVSPGDSFCARFSITVGEDGGSS